MKLSNVALLLIVNMSSLLCPVNVAPGAAAI